MEQPLEQQSTPSAIPTELVRQFVASAHHDLATVQSMLEVEPGLLHAAMNWGGADWETALGAAAHVGRQDIARYLLDQGAHLDLFAAAMLGYVDVVKSIVEAHPSARFATGPHGISLLRHAYMGGEDARDVVIFLEQNINSFPRSVDP
ncbi:ankyrin repeat domain-containing protein [Paenibacillus guangzhouensis]|uniref:ankyrin repeat domain-containing protein n=1 Tax=Paenibacillus guangzhouensis TaxID=1473112 RepID=UPI001266C2A6|nr:ankyrin repeat domain-containing protein [Paenibacillus guangzhouensis]